MSTTITQHSDLLKHKATLYQGQTVNVCLSSERLSPNTPLEDVLASELTEYTRVVSSFDNDAGSYNETSGQLSFPTIEATFTATTSQLEWQAVFVLVGDVVAVIVQETPPIQLLSGQSRTYKITLKESLN